MPLLVLLVLVVRPVLPCNAGSSMIVLNMFGWAFLARSDALKVVVGVGWVKPRAAMREPEIVTTVLVGSTAAAGAWSAPALASVAALVASPAACWA